MSAARAEDRLASRAEITSSRAGRNPRSISQHKCSSTDPLLPLMIYHLFQPEHPSMSKSTSIRLSKRRHSEDASNSLESVPNHRGSKRRKPTDRPQQTHQTHWDRLSTVYLTANALKELNRRTADTKVIHPELRPRYHRSSRRRTQCQTRAGKAIAQLCKLDAHCQECEELRRLSRHGGPDLTEIRGVGLAPRYHRPSQLTSPRSFRRRSGSTLLQCRQTSPAHAFEADGAKRVQHLQQRPAQRPPR